MTRLLKTLLVIFLISLSLFVLSSPAQAQGDTIVHPYKECLEDPSMNLCKYSLYNLDYLFAGATKRLVDYPVTENDTNTGLLQSLSTATDFLYANRPVNTVSYFADISSRLKPSAAYAAVVDGATFLSPTLGAWKAFRNVAYVFFVIIFVALGFMIMFRAKLNPQTVIGIQQALPRIIVSLVLVTFSYAIAGFIVDLAFLGGNLITNIVVTTTDCPGIYDTGCIFGSEIPWDRPLSSKDSDTVPSPNVWPLSILGTYGGTGIIGKMWEAIKTIFAPGEGTGFQGLFEFIIAITVVGATFKIFFSLLTKYVTLIITTILMPLGFMWGALPGKQNTSIQLIKSMLSAALAFPAVMIFLGLAYYFAENAAAVFSDIPPFYTSPFTASVAGSEGAVAGSLVGIGMLMITPQIPTAIDKAFEAGPGVGAGTAEIGGILRKLPLIGGLIG